MSAALACVLKTLGPTEVSDSDLDEEEEGEMEEGGELTASGSMLPVSSGASASPMRGTGRTFHHRLQVKH
eukprot:4946123-Pyramimonas_sp.AAC.1